MADGLPKFYRDPHLKPDLYSHKVPIKNQMPVNSRKSLNLEILQEALEL